MKARSLLAAFILPIALMFFITGALYTWGIKGNYHKTTYEINLSNPLQDSLSVLVTLATKELTKYKAV